LVFVSLWDGKEKKGGDNSRSGERDSLCQRECMLASISFLPPVVSFFNASSAARGSRSLLHRTVQTDAGGVRLLKRKKNGRQRRPGLIKAAVDVAAPRTCRCAALNLSPARIGDPV
jgi:hypothetical protein